MARNEEKAQSMLYRFREAKNAELGIRTGPERRPKLALEVNQLSDAERWRQQVIRDISRKVSKIQDGEEREKEQALAGLSDYQVRDLNDEINKLMREKNHWERRIVELGGPDYFVGFVGAAARFGVIRAYGPGHTGQTTAHTCQFLTGYKYFGRAKDLPGVRELFEQAAPEVERRTRGDLYKNVDADYYGYRDEEDGVLLAYERQKELKLSYGSKDAVLAD
ncbi:MAG: Isy1-like splicing factor [Olpidium bornovanus]|uniref:Isy1-like splicing factor n=1 Tax=Olpidium bornovanus TaxID=278681 RepID=A0A8H7ZST6_9FUNG|nr:MAG: Isy1-like splicing factor [Olpidium bornovanus]